MRNLTWRPFKPWCDASASSAATLLIPYVDPDSGGINSRVLFLLEAPASAAAHGSTMLSPDNDDGTAANIFRLYQESGLRRDHAIHWNAVPWYIGDGTKIRAAKRADIVEGNRWLTELIDLMLLHGQDWREHQSREVREALASASTQVWVAEADATLVGFAGARVVDLERLIGEVYIVGVDPGAQHPGVGTTLTEHAGQWLREQGMRVAFISTGGDSGHLPARRLYERLGYRLFPSAQYFKVL